MSTYEDARLGLSFSYPASWSIDAADPTFIKLESGTGASVQVDSRLVGPTTLDDQLDAHLRELNKLPRFKETARLIRGARRPPLPRQR